MPVEIERSILDRLREIVFVANTPGYIVNTVVSEDLVAPIAETRTSDEIVREIKKLARQSRTSVSEDDALTVVALAIALRSMDARGIAQLQDLRIPWLRWWGEIRRQVAEEAESYSWDRLAIESEPYARELGDEEVKTRPDTTTESTVRVTTS